MPDTALNRVLRVLINTCDYYLDLQREGSKPEALALPAAHSEIGRGQRRRRRRTTPPRTSLLGGTFDNSVTAGEHTHQLSPAEDTQNMMNGLLARIAGNAGGDGS